MNVSSLFNPSVHRIWRACLVGALLLSSTASLTAQTTNRSSTTNRRTTPTTSTNRNASGAGGSGRSASSNGLYPNATEIGTAIITSDPESRRIIVVTDAETNEAVRQFIESLDKPKPQVLINVVFLQVTHNNDLDIGTEFSYDGSILGGNTTESTLTRFGLASATTGGFYNVTAPDISATIRALSVVGKTEILSRPSILARSSQQATIIVGQEVPFITNSRISDTGQTTNTVQYQDIGIILRVTPFINSEGLVEMIVTPEISALSDRTVAISDTVNTPVIDKRSADTVVVTPSNRTVVIGGLISDQTTDQDSKVPLLGSIPVVGNLFKRKVKTTAKTELMIFLTPHVIGQPTDLAALTEQQRENLRLPAKTFTPAQVENLIANP
jgi:general secretion pathway protein D